MKLYKIVASCFHQHLGTMVFAEDEYEAMSKFLAHAKKKEVSKDALKNMSVKFYCKKSEILE